MVQTLLFIASPFTIPELECRPIELMLSNRPTSKAGMLLDLIAVTIKIKLVTGLLHDSKGSLINIDVVLAVMSLVFWIKFRH